jgi:hypothetical protein
MNNENNTEINTEEFSEVYEYDFLVTSFKNLTKENEELKQQNNIKEKELLEFENEIYELKQQNKSIESDLGEYEKQIVELEKENDDYKKCEEEFDNSIKELNKEIELNNQLKKENEELKKENEHNTKEEEEMQMSIKIQQELQTSLMKEMELNNQLMELNKQFENDNKELKKKNEELEYMKFHLQKDKDNYYKQVSEMCNKYKKEKEDVIEEYKRLGTDIDNLKEESKQLEKRNKELSDKLKEKEQNDIQNLTVRVNTIESFLFKKQQHVQEIPEQDTPETYKSRKPSSPYIFFSNEKLPAILEEIQQIEKDPKKVFPMTAEKLFIMWGQLSEADKSKYIQMANADQARWKMEQETPKQIEQKDEQQENVLYYIQYLNPYKLVESDTKTDICYSYIDVFDKGKNKIDKIIFLDNERKTCAFKSGNKYLFYEGPSVCSQINYIAAEEKYRVKMYSNDDSKICLEVMSWKGTYLYFYFYVIKKRPVTFEKGISFKNYIKLSNNNFDEIVFINNEQCAIKRKGLYLSHNGGCGYHKYIRDTEIFYFNYYNDTRQFGYSPTTKHEEHLINI